MRYSELLYQYQQVWNNGQRPDILQGVVYPLNLPMSERLGPNDFYWQVFDWNANRIMGITFTLWHYLNNLKGYDRNKYSVLLVGSDGRMEKGPYSPLEFTVLASDRETGMQLAGELHNRSKDVGKSAYVDHLSHRIPLEQEIEVKVVGKDFLSGYMGNSSRIWPDRILSATLIAGSEEVLTGAREIVLREMTERRNKRKLNDELARRRRLVSTGVVQHNKFPAQHFNKSTGELFYNKTSYLGGTKQGHMRLLQIALTKMQLDLKVVDVPTNTIEKLLYLCGKNSLTNDVGNAYQISLWAYHLLQSQVNERDEGKITMDVVLLNNISNTLLSFVS